MMQVSYVRDTSIDICWAEVISNSEKLNPVALAIFEICLSETPHREQVSQPAENSTK